MKRLACAGLAVATFAVATAPVFAADLPQPVEPVPAYDTVPSARFDWSGFYAGGTLGWGWGQFENSSTPTGSFNTNANGVQGGIHAGYNYAVTPNVITGLEADFLFSDMEKTSTRNGIGVKSNSDWNSSIRGRLGYAFDRFMVYGTGGLAIADLTAEAGGASESKTALGWTVGAGVETAVTQNVTARLEYAYQDFGRESFTLNGTRYRSDLDDNQVRFGLSYKF